MVWIMNLNPLVFYYKYKWIGRMKRKSSQICMLSACTTIPLVVLIEVHAIANFSLWRYTEHNIKDLFELCVHALAHMHTYWEIIIEAMVGNNKWMDIPMGNNPTKMYQCILSITLHSQSLYRLYPIILCLCS